MAPKYKLTYADAKALGEPIRFLLSYGGVEFEDHRLKMDNWETIKPKMPFGKIPVLEIDGKMIHQSVSICRYLAQQFGVGGKDEWEKLEIDIMVDTITDLRMETVKFAFEKDEELKAKLKEPIMKTAVPFCLTRLNETVKKNGGHFVGGKLTWADLYWTGIVDFLNYVCGEDLTEKYPDLKGLEKKVLALPAIKAWVAKRPVTQM